MTKVAFIGAGSIEHDIDEERLGYAEALVRRINEQTGASARVGSSCGFTRNKAARECVRA
jgi:alpha-galactosidase/6-phospho-beta-glucosidase family protein